MLALLGFQRPQLHLQVQPQVKVRVLFPAQVQSPSGLAAGMVPDEALVQSTDRLMQLAASHAWSRQGTLAATAEHSLFQLVSSAEEGMAAAVCTPHAWPNPEMHMQETDTGMPGQRLLMSTAAVVPLRPLFRALLPVSK